jgi:hypothetical protein
LIDFEAVVRHFGEEAVRLQLQEAETLDNPALTSLRSKNAPGRVEILRRGFITTKSFKLFRLTSERRWHPPYCNGLTQGICNQT